MKKTVSLKENHEFRRLYHRGVSTAGKHVVIYCRRNKLGCNRLGLTVSVKLGKAVQRNRIKRRLRADVRARAGSDDGEGEHGFVFIQHDHVRRRRAAVDAREILLPRPAPI